MKIDPLKMLGLINLAQGKTVADLSGPLLQQLAESAGIPTSPEAIQRVLSIASAADPETQLIDWASSKIADGSLQQLLRVDTAAEAFLRCPHCLQPFVLAAESLNS
jgi:hypothetical protein